MAKGKHWLGIGLSIGFHWFRLVLNWFCTGFDLFLYWFGDVSLGFDKLVLDRFR